MAWAGGDPAKLAQVADRARQVAGAILAALDAPPEEEREAA